MRPRRPTLIYGLGQSTEVAMRLFLFQKKIRIHNNFSSTQNQQQIPSEQMATDCFKFARRVEDPFGITSNQDIVLVLSLRFELLISRNGSRRCSSNHRLNELLQSSIKANSKGWWFLLWKWNTSICSTSYLYIQRFVIAHLYFCCCAACAYIFLLVIIWAASATGRWLWQRGRSIGPLCMYACLPSSLLSCVYTATNENALSASFEIPGARCWRRFQHWHRRWRSWPYDQL